MTLPEIATLWIGPEVSWLEQLCLKSFVDAGHEMTVFTYDHVAGLPEGVRVAPASDIMPSETILRHARTGSPAYHADIFRLRLMEQTDMIWADSDAYCVRPWEIAPDAPFYGWISDDVEQVNNGVLRLPRGSATLERMTAFAADPCPIPPWLPASRQAELRAAKEAGQGVHVSELPWGVLGPDLLTYMLKDTGEIEHAQPGPVIYPIPFKTAGMVLNANRRDQTEALITDETLSIHFWGRRFRNMAAKRGGAPDQGSYAQMLLDRHGIDAGRTAHLMKYRPPSRSKRRAELPASIDFSMFSTADVANLVLQRSEVVDSGEAVRAWIDGDDAPIRNLAEAHRDLILERALDRLREECELFLDAADEQKPARVADIGCGYAFASLVLHHRYGCDLVLIDKETTPDRHFAFAETGAAYSDLSKARAFLEANGVPPGKITTINPSHQDLAAAGQVDLAISLISCGFHYPAETYETFFRTQVTPEGQIVLDIRKGSGGIAFLKGLGKTEVLEKFAKHAAVLVRKETVPA